MDNGLVAPRSTLSALGGSMSKGMTGKKTESNDADMARMSKSAGSQFIGMAVNMTWQLAIVVLVPIIVGVRIDKAVHSGNTYTIIGLIAAVAGSIAVMWRAMQAANKVPVPKLTEKQKRTVKKSYEDEDKDD